MTKPKKSNANLFARLGLLAAISGGSGIMGGAIVEEALGDPMDTGRDMRTRQAHEGGYGNKHIGLHGPSGF